MKGFGRIWKDLTGFESTSLQKKKKVNNLGKQIGGGGKKMGSARELILENSPTLSVYHRQVVKSYVSDGSLIPFRKAIPVIVPRGLIIGSPNPARISAHLLRMSYFLFL